MFFKKRHQLTLLGESLLLLIFPNPDIPDVLTTSFTIHFLKFFLPIFPSPSYWCIGANKALHLQRASGRAADEGVFFVGANLRVRP
jgi:hypothetical protein